MDERNERKGIDKYLAWLNVNINFLSDRNSNRRISLLQRRRARYQRDILIKARDVYEETRP